MNLKERVVEKGKKSNNEIDQKALLAFWEYKDDTKEFDCIESFEITQPIPFQDLNYDSGKRCQKIFLYRGQSEEIFWFSPKDEGIELNVLPRMTKFESDDADDEVDVHIIPVGTGE